MASQHLKKLSKYIPLWQRHIPRYPLYVKGNPQLRVFLPLFWMKIIRQEHKMPDDHICFEVHPQMSKFDVQNYLEKIYGVSVLTVRTRLIKGKEINAFGPLGLREDHRRLAFVQLEDKFEIPDMFADSPTTMKKAMDQYEELKKKQEVDNKKQWAVSDVPMWFR